MSFYTEGADAVTELKPTASYVSNTHLKEHNGKFQDWNFSTLGTGVVDFAGVHQVLKEVGYTGPWIIQIEDRSEADSTEAAIKERMAKSVVHLRSIGYGN